MYEITSATFIFLVLTVILAITIPIAMLIVWKLRTKSKMMPAIAGAIIFVVFALILEGIPKAIFFTGDTAVSKYVLSHAWAYILLGTVLAGVFEETGRWVAFRFFLKKYQNKAASVMYGIGHGGIESILILGMTGINYLAIAVMMQNGSIDALIAAAPQVQSVNDTLAAIAGFGGTDCLLMVVERICAIVLHISLSIVVFEAVRQPKKSWMFPLAILLHMVFDVPAAMFQIGIITLPVCEAILVAEAVAVGVIGYRVYRSLKTVIPE